MSTAPCFCKKIHEYSIPEALQVMRRTPDSLRLLLDAVNPGAFVHKKGKAWSPREILTHLIDTEFAYGFRFRSIMGQKDSQVSSYDQEQWATTFTYGNLDATQLIRAFTPLRRVNLELLQGVDPKLFESAGHHPEYGTMRVSQMIPHIAAHDLNHLQQIRDRIPPM